MLQRYIARHTRVRVWRNMSTTRASSPVSITIKGVPARISAARSCISPIAAGRIVEKVRNHSRPALAAVARPV